MCVACFLGKVGGSGDYECYVLLEVVKNEVMMYGCGVV